MNRNLKNNGLKLYELCCAVMQLCFVIINKEKRL